MRALIISTDANEAAIDRMWITWKIGIAQKWVTIQPLEAGVGDPQRELHHGSGAKRTR